MPDWAVLVVQAIQWSIDRCFPQGILERLIHARTSVAERKLYKIVMQACDDEMRYGSSHDYMRLLLRDVTNFPEVQLQGCNTMYCVLYKGQVLASTVLLRVLQVIQETIE